MTLPLGIAGEVPFLVISGVFGIRTSFSNLTGSESNVWLTALIVSAGRAVGIVGAYQYWLIYKRYKKII